MVMLLAKPTTCSLQLVDDVIAERQNGKNASFFNGIAIEWRDRVQAFIDAGGSPEIVQAWPHIEEKKNTLLNLYLSPACGSVQGSMLATMRAHSLSLCPACGEAGAPNTLDHYLPKGKYPHFCITPLNLFPMCDACQTAKKEKTMDKNDDRIFIHPYFDIFVADQVLSLSISPPFNTPVFDFVPVPELSIYQQGLVSRHIQELGIVSRYTHFFLNQHMRLLRLTQSLRDSGLDVVQNLTSFRSSAALPTKNAWEYVFYDAVLSNADMLEYLREHKLPSFV